MTFLSILFSFFALPPHHRRKRNLPPPFPVSTTPIFSPNSIPRVAAVQIFFFLQLSCVPSFRVFFGRNKIFTSDLRKIFERQLRSNQQKTGNLSRWDKRWRRQRNDDEDDDDDNDDNDDDNNYSDNDDNNDKDDSNDNDRCPNGISFSPISKLSVWKYNSEEKQAVSRFSRNHLRSLNHTEAYL